MNVTITTDGQIRFLTTPELQPLSDLGQVTTRRASHVIPQNWLLRLAFRILRTCVPDDSRMRRMDTPLALPMARRPAHFGWPRLGTIPNSPASHRRRG